MDDNIRNEHHDHHHGMEMESKPTIPEQSAAKEGMEHRSDEDISPAHAAHAEQSTPIDQCHSYGAWGSHCSYGARRQG